MTLSRRASVSVIEMLLRTASSAQWMFLCLFSLMLRIKAAASLVAFSFIIESFSPPCMLTGWAAPMLVPGAMAAMFAARVINEPAEADCAPAGET